MNRRLVALTASVLLLAGCAGRTDATTPAPDPDSPVASPPAADRSFNDTDVMFLQMMAPHHRQGVAIARLAEDRPVRREVKLLAAAVETTQRSEIRQMSGWLRSWGQPATAPAASHAAHGGMPGTSKAEIDAVRRARDADFERRFLNLLIAHQDDAIQIARMETADGRNRAARDLARRIEKSRSAQIKQMLGFLRQD